MQRSVLVALAITVCLALLWFLFAAPGKQASITPPDAIALQWQAGASQLYKIDMDSSMQLDAAGVDLVSAMNVQINGTLEILVLQAADDSAVLGFRLPTVQMTLSGNTQEASSEALKVPFRVSFHSGGIPRDFEFPAAADAEHRVILENIVRSFQVTVRTGEDSWIAREQHASGSVESFYQHTAPGQLSKSKRNFRPATSNTMLADASISSHESISIDSDYSWISRMDVDEILLVEKQGRTVLQITNKAKLLLLPNAKPVGDSALWDFDAAAAPEEKNNPLASLSPAQARRQLVEELSQLDAAEQGRMGYIHQMRDLLQQDATLPALLLEQMQTQSLSDRSRADIYLALELAGTEAAQAALASVINNPDWTSKDYLRAIVALGGVDQPSDESLAILWEFATTGPRQLASTATFALGSLGSAMNTADNPDYAGLRDNLLNGAFTAEGAEQRANYLLAIGNTRDPGLAEDVALMLDDEDPAVRRAAALSLGQLGAEQSVEGLRERFKQESSGEVRSAITQSLVSLSAADTSTMALMGAAIQKESNEKARYAMAVLLSSNLQEYPQYRNVLQDIARQEPSRRIRQTIASALAE